MTAPMQSYLLRGIAGKRAADDSQWQKGWYRLDGDALRGYDSAAYTIVRWRTFVSAFETVRAVHSAGNGEPSQVILSTNVGPDEVFAAATPALADAWALKLQKAILPPLMKGQLYHRVISGKSKTWDHHYFELRGKELIVWNRQTDKEQRGTLSLAFASSIKRSKDATSMHLTLTNRKGQSEKHELRAESSRIIEEWILAIGTSLHE